MTLTRTHNKKRNSALLYNFLIMTISRSLVEGNQRQSQRALRVLKKHYKPTSELFREFRLVNSLIETTVSSNIVANSIIQEAKRAVRMLDETALDRQKSLLIRDINHVISDPDFYDQHINEYRIIATIQTLVNDWRSANPDLKRMALYEEQLVNWLTTERPAESDVIMESPGTNRLLMKIMMKKLNEKYSNVLNDDQKALIRAYAFSTANDETLSIQMKLNELRDSLVSAIDTYASATEVSTTLNEKLLSTKRQLVNESLDKIDDELVTRFMLYTKLKSELEESGDDDV